jgi:diguanylate cyclase (GGDEF)-like protein
MDARPIRPAGMARWLSNAMPVLPVRLSVGTFLGLALLAVLAVPGAGIRFVQQSTSETARLAGSLESHYEPALRGSRDLAESLRVFEHHVTGLSRAASPEDLAAVKSSGTHMLEVLEEYSRLARSDPGTATSDPRARLQAFQNQGLLIGNLYHLRAVEIHRALAALDGLATRAARAANGVESGDQVFALKSLAEASRAAATLRASMMSLFAAPSTAAAHVGARDRAAFDAVLRAHSDEFTRSPGRAWLDLEQEDLALAARGQSRFLEIERRIETARAAFEGSAQELAALIENDLQKPAWQALTREAGRARVTAEEAQSHLARVAMSVLAVALVIAGLIAYGIMAPARRLLEGTRRLARGTFDTPVPRGGVLELDELAVAFNDMAKAVHTTQKALSEQQAVLEDRVAERTEQLRHLAHHDPLTGLPNRRELQSHLAAAIDRARTRMTCCAIFYMDIDNFKTINDSLGHEFGDRVLCETGARLLGVAGAKGFLARLGGDEFTLVVEELDSGEVAENYVGRILRAFQKPVHVGDRDVLVSLSVGIAMAPEHGETSEALLRAADSALFSTKDRGRNGFSLYRPELLAAASHRFQTEQGLRRALETGDLLLYFQPEVCLADMKTSVIEALLRWRHPDGRIAPAGEFMAIAEQSGLILELGDWVLRQAIDAARQLRSGPWPRARVAINVSAQQFLTGRFVEAVDRALREAQMPANCLEIELTETAVQTGRLAVDALHELRGMGVTVALDDFGAGYSSLKSIDELPLTRVKLDRSLMKDVDSNARTAAIAHSVMRLCRTLGLTVTAEGIERPEQLQFAADFRDVHYQGYLIARPAPLNDITRFVSETASRLESILPAATAGRDRPAALPETSLLPFRRPPAR